MAESAGQWEWASEDDFALDIRSAAAELGLCGPLDGPLTAERPLEAAHAAAASLLASEGYGSLDSRPLLDSLDLPAAPAPTAAPPAIEI